MPHPSETNEAVVTHPHSNVVVAAAVAVVAAVAAVD